VLVATWVAGRVVMWTSAFLPAMLVAVIDLSYLPLLAVVAGQSLMRRPAPRNLIFPGLLALLAFANASVHAEWLGLTDDTAAWGLRLAVLTYGLLIAIIGGRVVPAFTRNALMHRGETQRLPRSIARLDGFGLAASLAVVIAAAAGWPTGIGWAALSAGVLNGARLGLWRPLSSLGEPIVWSLHLGFAALVAGYATLAAADLGGWPSETAALHVIAIGAIGCMTLAVMTRAALGHTGRALAVTRLIALAYLLVAAAALLRGFGTQLFPAHYFAVIMVAGGAWMVAFGLFTGGYARILAGPPEA